MLLKNNSCATHAEMFPCSPAISIAAVICRNVKQSIFNHISHERCLIVIIASRLDQAPRVRRVRRAEKLAQDHQRMWTPQIPRILPKYML